MLGSKLSADVPPFIPLAYRIDNSYESTAAIDLNLNGLSYSPPVTNEFPAYITNCYPFVQESNNSRWQQSSVIPTWHAVPRFNNKNYYARRNRTNMQQNANHNYGSHGSAHLSNSSDYSDSMPTFVDKRRGSIPNNNSVDKNTRNNFAGVRYHNRTQPTVGYSCSNQTQSVPVHDIPFKFDEQNFPSMPSNKDNSSVCRTVGANPSEISYSKIFQSNDCRAPKEVGNFNEHAIANVKSCNSNVKYKQSKTRMKKEVNTINSNKNNVAANVTDKDFRQNVMKRKEKTPMKKESASTYTNSDDRREISSTNHRSTVPERNLSGDIDNTNEEVIRKKSNPESVEKKRNIRKKKSSVHDGKVVTVSPQLLASFRRDNESVFEVLKGGEFSLSAADDENYPALPHSKQSSGRSISSSLQRNNISSISANDSGYYDGSYSINHEVPTASSSNTSMSFSDILKKPVQVSVKPVITSTPKKDGETSVRAKNKVERSKQGKKKSKSKKIAAAKKSSNKKSVSSNKSKVNTKVEFDLGKILENFEEKKKSGKNEKEVNVKFSGVRVLAKKENIKSVKGTPHNILDSSAPVRKRGKEREVPKKKKQSPLKKVILMERNEKKQRRLSDELNKESKCKEEIHEDTLSCLSGIENLSLSDDSKMSKNSSSFVAVTDSSSFSKINESFGSPEVKQLIHSRKFREYCDHMLDPAIDSLATNLLQDLVRFQDRQYHKDPIKARARRRFVLGIREVSKHLKLGNIKCVVIAPNIEKIRSKGGLDEVLFNLISLANQKNIPFVFALNRKALGRICMKVVAVSCVGIFNYGGAEESFKELMLVSSNARTLYSNVMKELEKELTEDEDHETSPLLRMKLNKLRGNSKSIGLSITF